MAPLIPREGLYIDPLISLFKVLFLNPLVTALPAYWAAKIAHPYARSSQLLFLAGCIFRVNAILNKLARNNWRLGTKDWNWNKEVVLLTGGSSGVGAVVARLFAEKGVKVVVMDVQTPLYTSHPNIHFHKCDLRSTVEVERVAAEIKAAHGHPTVIINNAGIAVSSPLLESSTESIQRTFDVNIMAPFWVLRQFLPELVKNNHGHIVTMASLSTFFPIPRVVDYASTKSAVLSMHEGVALELQHYHSAPRVRNTVLVPSFIRTPLFKGKVNQLHFLLPLLEPETVGERIVEQVMSGQSGGVVYLPGLVALLACLRSMPEWVAWIMGLLAVQSKFDESSGPGGRQ